MKFSPLLGIANMHISEVERRATIIAMYTFLSGIDSYDDDTVVALYDKLTQSEEDDIDDFLEKMIGILIDEDSVFVWKPFEAYPVWGFLELVDGMRDQVISQFKE